MAIASRTFVRAWNWWFTPHTTNLAIVSDVGLAHMKLIVETLGTRTCVESKRPGKSPAFLSTIPDGGKLNPIDLGNVQYQTVVETYNQHGDGEGCEGDD